MPIVNAKVEIYKDSELIVTGYTDSEGKFSTALNAGTYRVVISKEGYATQEKTETLSKYTELMVNLPSIIGSVRMEYSAMVGEGANIPLTATMSYETSVA